MKEIFKHVRTDKIIKWALYASFTVLLLQVIIVALSYTTLPPYLPLFNQLPWGEDRLGTKIEIFLPLLIEFAFFILNFSLITKLYEKLPLVSRILGITTLLITVLAFIFILRTLYLIL